MVKNPPANSGHAVLITESGGSPEKEMATQSNILVWRIPWTEEPGGLQSTGSQESDTSWQLNNRSNVSPSKNHGPLQDADLFTHVRLSVHTYTQHCIYV